VGYINPNPTIDEWQAVSDGTGVGVGSFAPFLTLFFDGFEWVAQLNQVPIGDSVIIVAIY
jgi:hypothetical protein